MAVEERSLRSNLYRIELYMLKIIPMVLAGLYALNTILSYFGIDWQIFSILGGISLFPLAFLYISSYTFRFCKYHRMFLHYVVLNDIICWIDYKFAIPIDNWEYLMIHIIVMFVCISLVVYFKFKGK